MTNGQWRDIDARLTREIRESGAAGSILFAWIDEWFKKNWIVIDFEIPLENTRQWHNVMDAEQNYGVLGMYAGAGTRPPGARRAARDPGSTATGCPGGQGAVGPATRPRSGCGATNPTPTWRSGSRGWPGGPSPGTPAGLMIAVDTWLPRLGQHSLPGTLARSEVGFEFLADLRGPRRRPDPASSATTTRTAGPPTPPATTLDGSTTGRSPSGTARMASSTRCTPTPTGPAIPAMAGSSRRGASTAAGSATARKPRHPRRLVLRPGRRPAGTAPPLGPAQRHRSLDPHHPVRTPGRPRVRHRDRAGVPFRRAGLWTQGSRAACWAPFPALEPGRTWSASDVLSRGSGRPGTRRLGISG